MENKHIAWRFLNNGTVAFVEWVGNGQQKGDRYSYTSDESKAKPMTEKQCRDFCSYMRACGTVGFWS
jgi:hypothetical protein